MFFVRVNGERRIITPMRHRTDRDSVDNYSILTDIFNREDMFKMVYYQYPRYRPHMPFAKRESFSITDMVAEGESYLIRVTLDDSGRIFSRLLFR